MIYSFVYGISVLPRGRVVTPRRELCLATVMSLF
jgi:hypothetical protein